MKKAVISFFISFLLVGAPYAQAIDDGELKCLGRIASFYYSLEHSMPLMAEVEISIVQGLLARGVNPCEIAKRMPFFQHNDKFYKPMDGKVK